MPAVLTTGATVACKFQGTVAVTDAAPVKLVVAGEPVAVASGVSGWTVAGCAAMLPSGTASPCATVAAPSAGVAVKLVVGGSPVLLKTVAALTVGSGVPHPVSASDAGQDRLRAV